jgi:predicted DCC family thiol-disulfide oxidoreductase YuxK
MAAIFLFDGDCAFCSQCARFIERFVPSPARVQPWQHTDLAALGVTRAAAADAVLWVEPGVAALAGPVAIARLLRTSGARRWRPIGRVLGLRPVTVVAWPIYRWISRHRHRLPGGSPACALPQRPA